MSMTEFTGQTYGEGARQRASQRMMRPGPSPTDVAAARAAGSRRTTVPRRSSAPPPQMEELPPLMRPTDAPDEPITAGIPMGEGPNAPTVPMGVQPGSSQDLALRVRAIASKYPNPALLQMVQMLERRNGLA